MFLSCTYETYDQESRSIFNVATPHSSPISSTWDFYYSLKKLIIHGVCKDTRSAGHYFYYSTRMRFYHRRGYEPLQYPGIPGDTRT